MSNAEPDSTVTFPPESPIGSDADTIVPDMGSLKLSNQASCQNSVTEQESKSNRDDFPFPKTGPSSVSSGAQAGDASGNLGLRPDLIRRDSRRPKLSQRATDPVFRHKASFSLDTAISSAVTKSGEVATSTVCILKSPLPSLLLFGKLSIETLCGEHVADYSFRPVR